MHPWRSRTLGLDLGGPTLIHVKAVADSVASFVEQAGGLIRVVFPDGELGRPGDNLYRLTYLVHRPHKVLLELDEQLLLILTEPLVGEVTAARLALTCDQVTLDWQEYGNLQPRAQTWLRGGVELLSQDRL